MKPVPDRTRQRREYLRKKGLAYTVSTVSTSLLLFSLFVAAYFVCVMMYLHRMSHHWFAPPHNNHLLEEVAAIASQVVVLSGVVSFVSWRAVKTARKTIRDLPDVPPVIPSNLPVEEILVRGAEEPSAPRETLLRVSVEGAQTAPDQLLRVVPGVTEAQDR
jgi:hypothetical protein